MAKHLLLHFFKPTLYEDPLLPYDYTNWTINHIWLHKQPVSLWLIAASLKVFGISAWAVRVPSVILSTIGIKLMYDVAAFLYDKSVAIIAAFLFSINGLILDVGAGRSATDHVDLFFLFFILLAIWACAKHVQQKHFSYIILIGVSTGLAVLTKWLPAFIVLPVYVLMAYQKLPIRYIMTNVLAIVAIACIVFVPWQLYIISRFPMEATWEYQFNTRHIYERLGGQEGNFFYQFDELRMMYGELIYLPVLWFIYKAIKNKKINDLIIVVWFAVPYLFFSLVATKMPAYTLFAAPAIFIITAAAFTEWNEWQVKQQWGGTIKGGTIKTVVTYCLILLPVRYAIERIKPFDNDSNKENEWMSVINNTKVSPLNTPATVIFGFDHPIEMMFHTNCVCYESIPGNFVINKLSHAGYNIVVMKK